ncbi:hypothetical protein GQR58_029799 [Nymphon striatum]|nr:hypothetical protein GQR58_029799 [Nymphon striatum]
MMHVVERIITEEVPPQVRTANSQLGNERHDIFVVERDIEAVLCCCRLKEASPDGCGRWIAGPTRPPRILHVQPQRRLRADGMPGRDLCADPRSMPAGSPELKVRDCSPVAVHPDHESGPTAPPVCSWLSPRHTTDGCLKRVGIVGDIDLETGHRAFTEGGKQDVLGLQVRTHHQVDSQDVVAIVGWRGGKKGIAEISKNPEIYSSAQGITVRDYRFGRRRVLQLR